MTRLFGLYGDLYVILRPVYERKALFISTF
jgi:hypothetical protein